METKRLRKDYLVLGRNQVIHTETMYVSNTRSKSVGIFFMILCISFYNRIQRSRRIVHIRHHAANIDEVSPWGAVIGGVCLYLAPGLLFPRHIYRNSSITIGFADTPPAAQHNKLVAQASVCLSFKNLSSVALPINIGSPPFKPNLDLPNRDLI